MARKLVASALDREITIQFPTETTDAAGQRKETWSTFATVWSEVQTLPSRERFVAEGKFETKLSIFRIRWLSGVTSKMRILHDGQTFRILGVMELGRREGLEITAEFFQ